MAKRKLSAEEKQIELLEKLLITELYVNGAKRDQIKKILGVASGKVNPIIKYLKPRENK